MTIEIHPSGKSARVVVAGELTVYSVAEIRAGLSEAMVSADEIEVDLSGVTEVDTAGVQMMLIAKRNPDKKVLFSNHPKSVMRLLDLANLGEALGDPLVLDAAHS